MVFCFYFRSPKHFDCVKEGYFGDDNNCRITHICKKIEDDILRYVSFICPQIIVLIWLLVI